MKIECIKSTLLQYQLLPEQILTILPILEDLNLEKELTEITPLEKGMTNQLLLLKLTSGNVLLRLPGAGTEHIINRRQEAEVYGLLKGTGISDEVLYLNPETGIKLTRFIPDSHNCNPNAYDDVKSCIRYLKKFHALQLSVSHVFDVFAEIRLYENYCGVGLGGFPDSLRVRSQVMELRNLIGHAPKEMCLCHIDPVYDNFLITPEDIYLIDWEYAAMCDPHIDIAMFCIYADYDKKKTDEVIHAYLEEDDSDAVRMKIYAYMSACAYLWVLWSEIKKLEGVDFTEYERSQYRLTKEFYQYAMELYRKRK